MRRTIRPASAAAVFVKSTPGVIKKEGLMMVGNGPGPLGVKMAMSIPNFLRGPKDRCTRRKLAPPSKKQAD